MATYPTEAVGLFTTATFTSMADTKPDAGFSSDQEFNTIIFETEAGYEKRRLRSRRPKRSYSLKYTNVTGLEKSAIETFYRDRSGNFDSFYFDLSHVNETGTLRVRFDGSLKVDHILSLGANALQNYYTVSFSLKESFD
jgi:hypothetical protein